VRLTPALHRAAQWAVSLVRPDTVHVDGAVIPHQRLRTGGQCFSAHSDFIASAQREAHRLVAHCGLTSSSTVVDVGCGVGRLPIGILQTVGEIDQYLGVDVSRTPIRWCTRHITRRHPHFRFAHIDVYNARYNRDGRQQQQSTRLPVGDHSVDIVYLYSVFSHLLEDDIRAYLREFQRILKPTGVVFLTAFVEEGVAAVAENPAAYGDCTWKGPLHCVRYEKTFFTDMLREEGFAIAVFDHRTETNGQSRVYLRLNGATADPTRS
jgi:ubiquinone/menaquinone biosynthesis C-methylase UbiE